MNYFVFDVQNDTDKSVEYFFDFNEVSAGTEISFVRIKVIEGTAQQKWNNLFIDDEEIFVTCYCDAPNFYTSIEYPNDVAYDFTLPKKIKVTLFPKVKVKYIFFKRSATHGSTLPRFDAKNEINTKCLYQ